MKQQKKAVELSGGCREEIEKENNSFIDAKELKKSLKPEQRYFRGLFCGGTLCAEALSILRGSFDSVRSNVAKK